MALKAKLETMYGDKRSLYIRINNVQVSNHGVMATALARGFISEAAFNDGKAYLWEKNISFVADVSQPLWAQAYATLCADPELAGAVAC